MSLHYIPKNAYDKLKEKSKNICFVHHKNNSKKELICPFCEVGIPLANKEIIFKDNKNDIN